MKKFIKFFFAAIIAFTMTMPTVTFAAEDVTEDQYELVEGVDYEVEYFSDDEDIPDILQLESEVDEESEVDLEYTEEFQTGPEETVGFIANTEQEKVLPEEEISIYATASTVTDSNVVYTINTYDNTAIVSGYEGNPTSLTIKSSINGYKVTEIGYSAFKNCTTLQSVSIPSSVASIGLNAFENCISLRTISIPSSVEKIDYYAFYNCKSLNSVTLNNGLKSIGANAFYNDISLTSITIPASVNSVGYFAFEKCTSLKTVKFTSGVSSIGIAMFRDCSALTTVNIPSSITEIPNSAFYNCTNLSGLTIEKGVITIGYQAFYGCKSLKSVNLPNTVVSIDFSAFYNCTDLTNVVLNENLIEIKDSAFYGCSQIKSINIPSSVVSIGSYAFGDCSALSLAQFKGDAPSGFGLYVFDKSASDFKINYLKGKLRWTTPTWNGYPAYPVSSISNPSAITVAPPSFKVVGIFGGRNVTFNCATPGATIYYTTANRSALYTSDPHVKPGETVTFNAYYGTVYARAYYNGQWSNVARLVLKIPKVNNPTIKKLSNGRTKITTTTPGTIVYYTIDGTTPSATNKKGQFWCSHDINIPAGKTVKAIAVRSCFSDSAVITGKS